MKRISMSWYYLAVLGLSSLTAAAQTQKVLIKASKPYTNLVNSIIARGGKVTYQYKYIDAIAAEIPLTSATSLASSVAPGAIEKDVIIPAPQMVNTLRGRSGLAPMSDVQNIVANSVRGLTRSDIRSIASTNPDAYLFNNSITGATSLHAAGILGTGIVVAVIDTGIRPGFPHLELDDSVVGCEDFVADGLGCSNSANEGHGTFVAGMISANVVFGFDRTSSFRLAVGAECPRCFVQVSGFPPDTFIPMIGSAPAASIYALRVFGSLGGSPSSRIIAAVERAIELRQKGINIRVANMSLGGTTLNAGQDLLAQAIDAMFKAGIVPVVSSGNAGPSSLTVGNTGSAASALTVGAASLPHNERILRRLELGPQVGALWRPFLGTQTAYFSSRGPAANGRRTPDVTANGFACFGQGTGPTTDTLSIGSGTSFSTPTVSGIVALLAQAFPNATAGQFWNAIHDSANDRFLLDDSTYLDQGTGYVAAGAARRLLGAGGVPSTLPTIRQPVKNLELNIERSTFLNVRTGLVTQNITALKPGERYDLLYRVQPNTKEVTVALSNVQPSFPPQRQNQLFGDDFLVAIHSAKTSSIGEGDYDVFENSTGDTWVIPNPETGIIRITLNGSSTNAGNISGRVDVSSKVGPTLPFTKKGDIVNGQNVSFTVRIPAGTDVAEFRLSWLQNWGMYPINDLDIYLTDPTGKVNMDGATIQSPEIVKINKPRQGRWTVTVSGFEVNTSKDTYEARAILDGTVVR